MGLSKAIQSSDILRRLGTISRSELKKVITKETHAWHAAHPEEVAIIRKNCARFGLDHSAGAISKIADHIALHYYEKLIPFSDTITGYAGYLDQSISSDTTADLIGAALKKGGVIVGIAHFGAVELIAPYLARLKLAPVNPVLRFTTKELSDRAIAQAKNLTDTGLFSEIRFVEVGKEGTVAALEMVAALRRNEILVTVFDEETPYSLPVDLLGQTVLGGSGLQNLLKFVRSPVTLFGSGMIRTESDRYRLALTEITGEPITGLYAVLAELVRSHPEQWYFLHEEIPFVAP